LISVHPDSLVLKVSTVHVQLHFEKPQIFSHNGYEALLLVETRFAKRLKRLLRIEGNNTKTNRNHKNQEIMLLKNIL